MHHCVQLLVFAATCALCKSKSFEECRYNGDMCQIDAELCIRRMEVKGLMRSCYGISYGSGLLYENREDAPFWITISKMTRHRFPEDLTYTIINHKDGYLGDWSVPGCVETIDGCCSLTLGESCVLPKRNPNDVFYVYLPLQNDIFGAPYCYYELEEAAGSVSFCETDEQRGCLEFVNGVLQRRNAFLPLSETPYTPKAEYCLFTVLDEQLDSAAEREITTPNIRIVLATFDDLHVIAGKEEPKACETATGEEGTSIIDLLADHHMTCFFLRVPAISAEWIQTPRCVRQSRKASRHD